MATNNKSMWFVFVALSMVVVMISINPLPQVEAAISCSTVVSNLTPCFSYLVYGGVAPSSDCCNGARSIYHQATSTPDRQAVCSCLKSVASSASVTPPMISNAASLPGKCGLTVPYQISPTIDCSRVQ